MEKESPMGSFDSIGKLMEELNVEETTFHNKYQQLIEKLYKDSGNTPEQSEFDEGLKELESLIEKYSKKLEDFINKIQHLRTAPIRDIQQTQSIEVLIQNQNNMVKKLAAHIEAKGKLQERYTERGILAEALSNPDFSKNLKIAANLGRLTVLGKVNIQTNFIMA